MKVIAEVVFNHDVVFHHLKQAQRHSNVFELRAEKIPGELKLELTD